MARTVTRLDAELQQRISDQNDTINRQRRELDEMRKELQYRMDAQRITEENSRQLYLDRERLTATVEILSRRIASDGIRTVSAEPINQAKAAPYRG